MYNIPRKIVVVFTILCAISCGNAFAVDSNWTGPDGGSWQNPDNWFPPGVPDNDVSPGVTYDVTISTTEKVRIGFSESVKVSSLTCSGEVDFEHGGGNMSLTITEAPLVNNGKMQFSGQGPYTLHGSFVNNSEAELMLSNLLQVKVGNVINDGQILIVGTEEHTGLVISDGGVLTNNGKIVNFHSSLSATGITNGPLGEIEGSGWILAGTIENQGLISASFGELSVISYEAILSNSGTIRNTAGASVVVTYFLAVGELSNEGMVEVNAGGGVTFNIPVQNEATGIIKLFDGVLATPNIIQTVDAGFSGFGTITGNITIEQGGGIQLTGPTNVIGTVDIGTNATLEISDGQTLITGHTTNDGSIHLKSGGIGRFQGGLTDNGTIIHETGSYYTQEELDQAVEVAISKYDPSLDGVVGLEEAVYALRTVSGIVSQ